MNQKKIDTVKFVWGCIVAFLAVCLIIIIYMKKTHPGITWKEILPKLGIAFLIMALVGIILYWILWKLFGGTGEKEIVPTTVAIKILTEEIAKENDIALFPPDKEDEGFCKLVDQEDILFRNGRRYYWKMTANVFYKIDVFVKRLGKWSVYQVQLDEGRDFIRKNYNMWVSEHKTHGTVDLEKSDYALATSQSWKERMGSTMAEMREQGLDTSGIESLMNQKEPEEKESTPAYAPRAYTPPTSTPTKEENARNFAEDYEQGIKDYQAKNK